MCTHSVHTGEAEESNSSASRYLFHFYLKNSFYIRKNGPEAEQAEWERYFTTGSQGLASWPRIAAHLKKRGYQGTICLTAEYTDEARVEELCLQDIAYAKRLFL